MSDRLDQLQALVTIWANGVAPNRQPKDTVVKLVSETSELLDAVLNKNPDEVRQELGDMIILLVDLAKMYNINIVNAGFDKMEVNRQRVWHADENGTLRRNK